MQRSTFPLSLMTTMQPARRHYVQSFRKIRLPSKDGAGSEIAGFEEPSRTSAAGDQRPPGVTFPPSCQGKYPWPRTHNRGASCPRRFSGDPGIAAPQHGHLLMSAQMKRK